MICVDDPDSRDYDDAFSVVKTDTGYRVGVHITDVAASLVPGSDLFKEVLERVSSLYLPAERSICCQTVWRKTSSASEREA